MAKKKGTHSIAGRGKPMTVVLNLAKRFGYTVTRTQKNHLKLIPPVAGFPPLFFAGTPSDHRSPRHALAFLKKQIREIFGPDEEF